MFEAWLDLTGTAIVYQSNLNLDDPSGLGLNAINLNGIVATNNGKYLIVVQTNTGKLFRIDIASKDVTEIDLGGATLTYGDGILLSRRRTLYVARNQIALIALVQLSEDFSRSTVVSSFANATASPGDDGDLLVRLSGET